MFRDDFSPVFVASFTLLLFLKSFHWLLEDRVDYVSTFSNLDIYICILGGIDFLVQSLFEI